MIIDIVKKAASWLILGVVGVVVISFEIIDKFVSYVVVNRLYSTLFETKNTLLGNIVSLLPGVLISLAIGLIGFLIYFLVMPREGELTAGNLYRLFRVLLLFYSILFVVIALVMIYSTSAASASLLRY